MATIFWAWLRANFVSMVLAAILAITVWVIATLEENPPIEREFSDLIEIELVGLDPGLTIINDYTETATVRLAAPSNIWDTLTADDVTIMADLSELGPGAHQVTLAVAVNAEQILSIVPYPDHILVEIEQRIEREMAVSLNIAGQPSVSYQTGIPAMQPQAITISGPLPLVESVSEVRAAVSIEERREDFLEMVSLVAVDNEGQPIAGVNLIPNAVEVSIPIKQVAGFTTVNLIIRSIGQPADGYSAEIEMTPSQIVVQGAPNILEGLDIVAVYVDVTGLTEDKTVEVPVNLPEGVTLAEEITITATITVSPLTGNRTFIVPIEIVGLEEGLETELIQEEIAVTLSGLVLSLDELNVEEHLGVYIDLTGLPAGTYNLTPIVEVRLEGIMVETFVPNVITLSLTLALTPTAEPYYL